MRFIACVACCAVLCGCIVLPESYYLPVSESGELERAACDAFGPNNAIVVSADGVAVRLWMYPQRNREAQNYTLNLPARFAREEKYLVLGFSISGAPGNVVALKDSLVTAGVDDSDERQYGVNALYRKEWSYSAPTAYADAAVGDRLDFIPRDELADVIYWGEIWLDVSKADSVHVAPIEVEINDRPVIIGPIDFIKKVGVYYYPINC